MNSARTLPFLSPILGIFLTIPAHSQEVGTAPTAATPPLPSISIPKDRNISLSPEQKRPLFLQSGERNPFARRNPDVDLITEISEQETEAELIRDALNSLSITGCSQGPKGLRVLAEGSLIFESGRLVDPVIEGQTETLVVDSVTKTQINLAWVDSDTGKLTGKRVIMTYDLTPKVRMLMKGQRIAQSETRKVIEVAFERSEQPKELLARDPSSTPESKLISESANDRDLEP